MLGLLETIFVIAIMFVLPGLAVAFFRLGFKGAFVIGCLIALGCNVLMCAYEEKPILDRGLAELIGRAVGMVAVGAVLGALWYIPLRLWRGKRKTSKSPASLQDSA